MIGDAKVQRRFHFWATIVWAVVTPVICFLIVWFRDLEFAAVLTLAWITLVSHYANVVSHWSAYLAARVEVKQDIQTEVANVTAEQANVRVTECDSHG